MMISLHNRKYNYSLILLALLHVSITALVATVSTWLMYQALNVSFAVPVAILLFWLFLAITAVFWYIPIIGIFQKSRRPIREEEIIIAQAVTRINRQTTSNWQPRIMLKDEPLIYAACCGRNTIILSTGALTILSINEIAAVLAHEQAHLQSKDTMAAATMGITSLVNKLLINIGMGLIFPVRYLKVKGWLLLIASTIFLCWINYLAPFMIMAAYTLPALALITFNKLISPIEYISVAGRNMRAMPMCIISAWANICAAFY